MFHVTKRVQTIALSTFIVLCPLVYTTGAGSSLREFQEKFFQLGAMCLICLFLGNIWMSLFMVWNVVLYVNNGMEFGGGQILNIFVGSLLFMVSRKYFTKSMITDLRPPILIITAITLIWMTFQLFHIDPIFLSQTGGGVADTSVPLTLPLGSFALQAANGIFMEIAALFIALANPILALFMLIPIALSKSSAVFMSAGVVILFYTFHLHRKMFIALSVISFFFFGILIFGDLKTDPATFGSRFPMWHATLHKAMEYPLGYGPDSFRNMGKHKNFTFNSDAYQHTGITYKLNDKQSGFTYYSPSNDVATMRKLTDNTIKNGLKFGEFNFWDDPHCEPLKIAFEYGVVGVILLFGFLSDIWNKFKHAKKDKELVTITCCLLVYFVSSLTQFPFSLARTAYLFPVILGAFFACVELNGAMNES